MIIDVDEMPIAWREAGAGAPVVFLHGLGMTRTGWDAQLEALAEGYRCVAWDLPGYGVSEPLAEFSLAAAADAAAMLIDRLCGTRSAFARSRWSTRARPSGSTAPIPLPGVRRAWLRSRRARRSVSSPSPYYAA